MRGRLSDVRMYGPISGTVIGVLSRSYYGMRVQACVGICNSKFIFPRSSGLSLRYHSQNSLSVLARTVMNIVLIGICSDFIATVSHTRVTGTCLISLRNE